MLVYRAQLAALGAPAEVERAARAEYRALGCRCGAPYERGKEGAGVCGGCRAVWRCSEARRCAGRGGPGPAAP